MGKPDADFVNAIKARLLSMKENEQVEATTSDFGICPDPDLEGFQQNIDNDVRSKQAEYTHILCFDKF
jgi:hypothetical protein